LTGFNTIFANLVVAYVFWPPCSSYLLQYIINARSWNVWTV